VKSRHFRPLNAWTASRWTFRLSYVTREGFCDILREIELAGWKSSLRRALSASRLSALAVAVVCRRIQLKKAERTTLPRFSYCHHNPVGEAYRFVLR